MNFLFQLVRDDCTRAKTLGLDDLPGKKFPSSHSSLTPLLPKRAWAKFAATFPVARVVRRGAFGVAVCMIAAVCANVICFAGSGVAEEAVAEERVSLTELRKQTSELLRHVAITKTAVQKEQALTALCDLYAVIRNDPRYVESEMLQQDASKIRHRLLKSANKLKAKLRRRQIPRPVELAGEVDKAIKHALRPDQSKPAVRHEDSISGSSSSDSASHRIDREHLVESHPEVGRAAPGIADNGWQLVELIERVIAPNFWQTNGGPGSVQYFAMRRVLVVRATTDVHEQIRDLLRSLPR